MNKYLTLFFSIIVLLMLSSCSEYQVQTGNPVKQQRYSKQVLKAAAISHDGRYTLISDNQQICLWDNRLNQKKYQCLQGLEAQLIELIGISKSNRYFYTSNRVNVHLYDLATGRLITVWSAGDNIINDIEMAENERSLIFGFRSGQASIVSVKSNKITTYDIHRLDINSVAISANGLYAFTGSSDKTATLWNTQNGEIIHSFHHKSRVNHVAISRDGKVGFTLDAIKDRFFWLLKIGKKFAELDSNIKFIEFNQSLFSANNQWLASASPKQKLQLWHVKDGQLLGQWQSFKTQNRDRASVIAIQFVDEQTLATVTSDGVYETWPFTPIANTE